MKRLFERSPLLLEVILPSLLAGTLGSLAKAEPPAPSAPAPGALPVSVLTGRDAELSRRLDSLLAAAEPATPWTISVESVGEKDRRIHRTALFSDGVGIWDDEAQFRLEPDAQKEILKAFRDNAFCQINDELFKEGSGRRKTPNGLIREQSIALEIGGVSKTVSHVVSTFGVFPDVEEAAKPLLKIVSVVQAICEKPAAKGVRAKDLADGLAKVAGGKLADVALKVSVSRPREADGSGWIARVEGKRVTSQVLTKGKGWAPPLESRLSEDGFLEFVRTVSAANPGTYPQNLYDEGYTDLSIVVLNRSVTVQARHFANMDPKAHEEVRKAYRTVVTAVQKLHEMVLLEVRKP